MSYLRINHTLSLTRGRKPQIHNGCLSPTRGTRQLQPLQIKWTDVIWFVPTKEKETRDQNPKEKESPLSRKLENEWLRKKLGHPYGLQISNSPTKIREIKKWSNKRGIKRKILSKNKFVWFDNTETHSLFWLDLHMF